MLRAGIYELALIIMLGVGSLLMFVGFDTHGFILESVTLSVHKRNPSRIDEYAGYYGLAVSHVCYAVANLFAPFIVSYLHPKWSLFIGSIGFTVYNVGFLYLNSYYFYISSLIMGIGFAVYYCGLGCYISEHSSRKNLARNSSLSWGITCSSFVIGGIILITSLQNDQGDTKAHQQYSDNQIRKVFGAFTGCALISNIILGFLPKKTLENAICRKNSTQKDIRLKDRLGTIFKAFRSPKIWLLSFSWIHLGIMTSELLGVYPTAIIFTESLQSSIKTTVFYGIAVSVGELSTAIVVSILSRRFTHIGRVPVFLTAFIVSSISATLILLSTSRYSPLYPNNEKPLLIKTNFYIAIAIGFLLGVSDGCWNTARGVIIPLLKPHRRAEVFSISKMFQSFASCVIFFVATMIDLYGHYCIMMVSNIIATITFIIVSRNSSDVDVLTDVGKGIQSEF
uniref:UNC93-like protein MFSD11 n=1 Tax=Syphacia muris TaxID=451379 RepID=A0A0N5AMX1_9BILA